MRAGVQKQEVSFCLHLPRPPYPSQVAPWLEPNLMGVAGPILWESVPSMIGGIVLPQPLLSSLSARGQEFWPSGGPFW